MDPDEEQAYAVGIQAMLWGYPLVCYGTTTQAAVRAGASHINDLRLFAEPKTAADRYVVTPNNVTLDGYGAFDVRAEPVVVHVPALAEPRWYIVQIGDMFDEIIHNIAGTKGPQPGDYVITGPDFRGELPGETTRIRSRTSQGVVAVRVFAGGGADVDQAVAAQRGFRLMPLSAYLTDGLTYEPAELAAFPAYRDTSSEDLRFFAHLGQAMGWFLPVSADRADPIVAGFRQIGLSVADGFPPDRLDESSRRGLARAAVAGEAIIDARWAQLGETVDGWRYYTAGGRGGHDLTLRAALVKYVLGAQLATEVLYPPCAVDTDGQPFSGQHRYVLHFPPGQVPPVSVFWNLAMYGDDMLFVENDQRRYSIGSTTDGLSKSPDGSLTVYLQHDPPGDDAEAANWLPAPEGTFNLTMRFYGPDTTVLDGRYRMPGVTRVG
jgi:hypothetical protein